MIKNPLKVDENRRREEKVHEKAIQVAAAVSNRCMGHQVPRRRNPRAQPRLGRLSTYDPTTRTYPTASWVAHLPTASRQCLQSGPSRPSLPRAPTPPGTRNPSWSWRACLTPRASPRCWGWTRRRATAAGPTMKSCMLRCWARKRQDDGAATPGASPRFRSRPR